MVERHSEWGPVWCVLGAAALAASLSVGCDATGVLRVGPCVGSSADPACGRDCSAEEPCATGFYCGADDTCTADCTVLSNECGQGATCTAEGRCVPTGGGDGGAVDDAGPPVDGGDPNICADVTVEARRVTPNVILVIDQSGSMTANFAGGVNRWNALRNSLLDQPEGLVATFESSVRFGLALYTAVAEGSSAGPPIGECPMVETIDPALDNYDRIREVYITEEPVDETPTGEALDVLTAQLTMTPDPSEDPTIFILATDGEPDQCEELNPQRGQARSVAAAEAAFAAGIRTFIISVGEGVVSDEHLQDMANAGLGRGASDEDAPFFVAGDDAGLRDALRSIIGGELSCELTLNGEIVDLEAACEGTVELNGNPLPCDDPNGWRANDSRTIELLGDACTTLLESPGVTLTASFPCEVAILI